VFEELYDMSSRDNDCVNQTSWIEPRCKKARTTAGTSYTDSEDSEEEIDVHTRDKKMCNNVSD
jgi:hypothetical protein